MCLSHLNPEMSQACCKQCDLYMSPSCCDLHEPRYTLGMFDAEVEPLSTKWNPQWVGPRTKYQKDESRSATLDKALCEWRREEFYCSYPDRHHDMWVGDWLVLPDNIIDDIIYLAHLNKLTCHDKFIQLVDWINCECYASELIPIIHQIFPPPEPPAITPNAPGTTEGNLRISRCSNC